MLFAERLAGGLEFRNCGSNGITTSAETGGEMVEVVEV